MNVLAIDTSTDYLSVAVLRDAATLGRLHQEARTSHSRLLVPAIRKVLARAGLRLKDVDGIALSIGPGSFTGLRIGVTTVKALALCSGKPVVTVPTLDVIALQALSLVQYTGKENRLPRRICPLLDAKKEKVYACLYERRSGGLRRVSGYLLLPLEDLLTRIKGEALLIGTGIDAYRDVILKKAPSCVLYEKDDWRPDAVLVGTMGSEKLKKRDLADVNDLAPFYIYSRECDIKGY